MSTNTSYIVKELSLEAMLSCYETYGPQFFPPEELKPSSAVRRLYELGIYRGFGLFDTALLHGEHRLAGYALMVCPKAFNNVLLDYYAILPQYRGQGAGCFFLQQLAEVFREADGIYIESETSPRTEPTDALSSEPLTRERRIHFYERNGAHKTGVQSRLFGVSYEVLFLPCARQKRLAFRHLIAIDAIYREMFSPKHYEEEVFLEI